MPADIRELNGVPMTEHPLGPFVFVGPAAALAFLALYATIWANYSKQELKRPSRLTG